MNEDVPDHCNGNAEPPDDELERMENPNHEHLDGSPSKHDCSVSGNEPGISSHSQPRLDFSDEAAKTYDIKQDESGKTIIVKRSPCKQGDGSLHCRACRVGDELKPAAAGCDAVQKKQGNR